MVIRMNKKISLGAALTVMAIVATVTFAITMVFAMNTFNNKVYNIKEREEMYTKVSEIDRIVRQNYYGDIDETELSDSLASGYMQGIGDKYGIYISAEDYSKMSDSYDGTTVGIGVEVISDSTGFMKVIEVYADSPASNAGIRKDDYIVKVNDINLNPNTYASAVEALSGEAGTKVNVVVRRGTGDMTFELTRRAMEIPTVSSRIAEDNIGIIRIKKFDEATPTQFNAALDSLLGQNVQALVFDVRGNPGGTITSVSKILDRLLPQGDIVSATYKDGTTEVLATSDAEEVNLPMFVLTNEKSASAAELFAQALKDYGKGKTVGTTTYGKGLMQKIFQLKDGSALDVTVAKYNPPKSENFDGVGVKPDFEVKLTPNQEKNFYDLSDATDPQILKALELSQAAIRADAGQSGGDSSSSSPEESSESSSESSGSSQESSESEAA